MLRSHVDYRVELAVIRVIVGIALPTYAAATPQAGEPRWTARLPARLPTALPVEL
jgi:hypothetical protein